MKEIPLTRGHVALVDDADFEEVNTFKWGAQKRGRCWYAARTIYNSEGLRTTLYLHLFLMRASFPRIDHRDGNGLNNQRHNLRPATDLQNKRSFQHKRVNTASRFRGVSYYPKRNKKWVARIGVNGSTKTIGYFENEKDAALAYDVAARKFFGEFAAPNFKI